METSVLWLLIRNITANPELADQAILGCSSVPWAYHHTVVRRLGLQIWCLQCQTCASKSCHHWLILTWLSQAAYHPGQVCMSTEIKLKILEERKKQLDRAYSKQVADDVRRKEEELLSLSIVEVISISLPCSILLRRTLCGFVVFMLDL